MGIIFDVANALPAWAVILLVIAMIWLLNPVSWMWRCRRCGRVVWPGKLGKAPFCPRCGAPRPRGPAHARVPIIVQRSRSFHADQHDRIGDILQTAGVADSLPAGTEAFAKIAAAIEPGTALADAHPWRREAVDLIPGLPPYPRRASDTVVPPGIVHVEIEAVEHWTGPKAGYHGFAGLFVSLLISLPDGAIWDARAEEAS